MFDYGYILECEIGFLVVYGYLYLFGYDYYIEVEEKEMFIF